LLLLVSGASGVGKTTARLRAAAMLGEAFDAVELAHLAAVPPVPTVAWRQQTVEVAVQRAIALAGAGRHLLLAGDPVPAGEVLAAPSADQVDVAACLLDADAASQSARLDARRDPPELRELHLSFAAWMRRHATDPEYVPHVVTTGAWPEMRWDRWVGAPAATERWAMTVVDTSHRSPDDVGRAVADWARSAICGDAPVFRAGWHLREIPLMAQGTEHLAGLGEWAGGDRHMARA
jgi:hypothetical protein